MGISRVPIVLVDGGMGRIGALVHDGLSRDGWELLVMGGKGNGRAMNHPNRKNGRVNNKPVLVHIDGPLG